MSNLNNIKIELSNPNLEFNEVKWYLADGALILGSLELNEDYEQKFIGTFGTENWLWQDTDIYRFSNDQEDLKYLQLNVLDEIEIEEEYQHVEIKNLNNIKTSMEVKLSPVYPQKTIYSRVDDSLVSFYSDNVVTNAISINEQFQFLVSDEEIIGWCLRNASTCLLPSRDKIENDEAIDSLILQDYLSFCNPDIFEKMDDEDQKILEALTALKNRASTLDSKLGQSVAEAVAGLIEGYY